MRKTSGPLVTNIDVTSTQFSKQEAEGVFNTLYGLLMRRHQISLDRKKYISLLEEYGFDGLAFILDDCLNSEELKKQAQEKMEQVWEEHLAYFRQFCDFNCTGVILRPKIGCLHFSERLTGQKHMWFSPKSPQIHPINGCKVGFSIGFRQLSKISLGYRPTLDERDMFEKRIHFFWDKEIEAIIANINQAKALREQAAPFLDGDSLPRARRLLDKAVAGQLADSHVWHDHGLVCLRQKDYEAAIPSYQKAIKTNMDDDYIWSCEDLKWCYDALGKQNPEWYETGLAFFKGVTEQFPDRWIAYHECGWLLMQMKQFEKATEFYLQAIDKQTDPTWAWSYLDLRTSYQSMEKYSLAYEYFTSLANNGSTNWGVWHSLGDFRRQHGEQLEDTVSAYQKAIEHHPAKNGWFWTWQSIGSCYKDSDSLDRRSKIKALEAFTHAKNINPENWLAWHGLAWANEQLQRWEDAIKDYEMALSLNSGSAWCWVGIARCYRKKKEPRYIQSWEAYQRVIKSLSSERKEYHVAKQGLQLLQNKPWIELRKILHAHFTLEEIRVICFDLNINFEDLAGATQQTKVVSLIEACQNRGIVARLLDMVRLERPHISFIANLP